MKSKKCTLQREELYCVKLDPKDNKSETYHRFAAFYLLKIFTTSSRTSGSSGQLVEP